jgi:hypothetical protein
VCVCVCVWGGGADTELKNMWKESVMTNLR